MKSTFIFLLDWLFPRDLNCVLCQDYLNQHHDANLCPQCLSSIQFNSGAVCKICGRMMLHTSAYLVCDNCKSLERYVDAGLSVALYDDYSKKILFDLKYHKKKYVAHSIAVLILKRFVELDVEKTFDCIVPVPLHIKKEKKRGYNQSELIAKEISRLTGLPMMTIIKRKKNTPSLNTLSSEARLEVLRDAFEVDGHISGSILLVDDIFTTGHTINFCSQVLKSRGAEYVFGLTFAVGI